MLTPPEVGRSSPASKASSVDLPLPEGPITATNSPRAIDRLTSSRTVIVFGPERVGLSGADESRCHRLVRIPAKPGYSSRNLAAAVQIGAYEVRRACASDAAVAPQGTEVQPASHEDVDRVVLDRKLPRQVDSFKLEIPLRANARGNVLAAGFPAHRVV